MKYFDVMDRQSMLPHLYGNFNKCKFAMFTKELALGCQLGDPLCLELFVQAGKMLAKHVIAVAEKAHNVRLFFTLHINFSFIFSVVREFFLNSFCRY